MNRRTFFKTVAAIAAAAVVAPAAVVANGTDRSVTWHEATWDWSGGEEPLLYISRFRNRSAYMFYVYAPEPIRKGQALVWNPDGTVRGV